LLGSPYRVRSAIGEEALRPFLAAVDGAAPELTTANVNDLFLLCEEFGFAALLSQISEFRLRHAIVDDEARKCVCRFEEQNWRNDRALCVLRKEVSDLRAAHLRLASDNGQLVETNRTLEISLRLLQKEVADLREADAREIAAMTAQFARENRALCDGLAKSDHSREQEILALREQQESLRAQFEQEIATLRQQLAEEITKVHREQAQSGEGAAALPKPHPGSLTRKKVWNANSQT
jgi:hypothetical protein